MDSTAQGELNHVSDAGLNGIIARKIFHGSARIVVRSVAVVSWLGETGIYLE